MALIKCSECGKIISEQAGFCPNCGAPNKKNIQPAPQGVVNNGMMGGGPMPMAPRPNNNNKIIIIVVIASLFVILLLVGAFFVVNKINNDKQLATQQAIEQIKEATAATQQKETPKQEAAPQPTTETWAGAVGRYGIHMKINNGTGEFYYYYDRMGANNLLKLNCTDHTGSHMTLVETNQYGENTGMFDGEISGNKYTGTFTNLLKGRTYSFVLTRQ